MMYSELIKAVRAKLPAGTYFGVGIDFFDYSTGGAPVMEWRIYRADTEIGTVIAATPELVLEKAFPVGVDLVDADQVVPAPAASQEISAAMRPPALAGDPF